MQHDSLCFLRTLGYHILKFQQVWKFENTKDELRFRKQAPNRMLLKRLNLHERAVKISNLKKFRPLIIKTN